MQESQFLPTQYSKTTYEGEFTWESPSNIALVKYWGKKENQIPKNPSISFTLESCKSITTLSFRKKDKNDNTFSFDLFFEGKQKNEFKPKILNFFKRVELYLPFLKTYHLKIETSNTFPHSSGIASSASGMSALALCLMSMEKEFMPDMSLEYFKKKASFLARLGSGSACRSIEGNVIVWGKHNKIEKSSDFFGIKFPYPIHKNFTNYQDTILLVDKGEKQVSSSVGHNLMHGHPFASERFKQANENISQLIHVLASGDLDDFIKIIESEALTLHAMMMTSMPYFILMKPNTLEIINRIWKFRNETGLHIGFTLDAGANVHVLYPEIETDKIYEFIKNELVVYCENDKYIRDKVGGGAKRII